MEHISQLVSEHSDLTMSLVSSSLFPLVTNGRVCSDVVYGIGLGFFACAARAGFVVTGVSLQKHAAADSVRIALNPFMLPYATAS